jgi:hypothetical protein
VSLSYHLFHLAHHLNERGRIEMAHAHPDRDRMPLTATGAHP